MQSGRTLWDELCFKYNQGVAQVRRMQITWDSLTSYVDRGRFEHVKTLLAIQEKEARWWRDACLLYFQTFSKMPIPAEYEPPAESLEYYQNLKIEDSGIRQKKKFVEGRLRYSFVGLMKASQMTESRYIIKGDLFISFTLASFKGSFQSRLLDDMVKSLSFD